MSTVTAILNSMASQPSTDLLDDWRFSQESTAEGNPEAAEHRNSTEAKLEQGTDDSQKQNDVFLGAQDNFEDKKTASTQDDSYFYATSHPFGASYNPSVAYTIEDFNLSNSTNCTSIQEPIIEITLHCEETITTELDEVHSAEFVASEEPIAEADSKENVVPKKRERKRALKNDNSKKTFMPVKKSKRANSKEAVDPDEYTQLFTPNSDGNYRKPPLTFTCLIALALQSRKDQKMNVPDMYKFISESFPYFTTANSSWKNSLRHNLSLEKSFVKTDVHRTACKGYDWQYNKESMKWINKEISKRAIKDISLLKHCLANEAVLQSLIEANLVANP